MRGSHVQYAQGLCKRALGIFKNRIEDLAISLDTSTNTILALQAGRDVPASVVLGLLALLEGTSEGVSVERREDATLRTSTDGQTACRSFGKRAQGMELRLAGDRTEYLPVKKGRVGGIYVLAGSVQISTGYSQTGTRLEQGDYVETDAAVSIHSVGIQVARLLVFWQDDRRHAGID